MYSSEAAQNLMVAAALQVYVMTWVFPALTQYLLAPRAKSQQLMDERCRIRDTYVAPFMISDSVRCLGVTMFLSSVFPVSV